MFGAPMEPGRSALFLAYKHGGGCHFDRRTLINQKQRPRPQPRDALQQTGEQMYFGMKAHRRDRMTSTLSNGPCDTDTNTPLIDSSPSI